MTVDVTKRAAVKDMIELAIGNFGAVHFLLNSTGAAHGGGARIRRQGIRTLSISPGPVRTPFQDAAQSSPELVQRFLEDVPMKRFGEPEEIGELVLFMCSDACEFMTADTVCVNGGGGWR
jgi:NAD(P)-dependent dehydrogenase (short-subunit alcohol dehydrogenase family)